MESRTTSLRFFKQCIDRLLHGIWSIIQFILMLLVAPSIILLSVGVAILFNISVDMAFKLVLGVILTLIGLYSICDMRIILEEYKVHKLFILIFGWLGPICLCYIGLSLMIN